MSEASASRGRRLDGLLARALHPVLFTAFPLLFLAQQNLGLISLGEAFVPLLVAVAVVALVYAGFRAIVEDSGILALRLTVIALWFFSYGHIATAAQGALDPTWNIDLLLLPVWTLSAVGLLVLVGRTGATREITKILNVVGVALVLVATLSIGTGLMSGRLTTNESIPAVAVTEGGRTNNGPARDIYYLIFDRYAGEQSLREFLGFDNSSFLKDLESRGFLVRNKSRGNYPNTAMSLAASLNMSYLEWLRDINSAVPIYQSIRNNSLGRFLKNRGYRYFHIGSWWDGTKGSDVADVSYRNDELSEYTSALYGSTLLSVGVRQRWLGAAELPIRHREIAIKQISTLLRLSNTPGRKFVFAHLLLPHPPYVFDRGGRRLATKPRSESEKSRAYVEQLRYTNSRIIEIVNALLESERKPIVIVQSDEGPHPGYGGIGLSDWTKAEKKQLLLKFRILNAYYLPGIDPSLVWPGISPVNSFRVVLNQYFGARLPILPDKSLVSSKRRPHEFVSVTDQVKN